MDTKQIIFKIGQEKYGIDILKIHEIENGSDIVRIPNAPECITGIMHLRGDVIPIYSIREKFGMDEDDEINTDDGEGQKLIIAAVGGVKIGFKVDSVEEILEIKSKDLFKAPKIIKGEDTEYIDKVACVDKKIIVLLDVDALVGVEELESINSMLEDEFMS